MTDQHQKRHYCRQLPRIPIVLPEATAPGRAFAIRRSKKKWVNGTLLHYHFVEDLRWDWPQDQKDIVHWAFGIWRDLGVGLRFQETAVPSEAEIKIGRNLGDGSWSFVGIDILRNEQNGCTMNLGWDLTTDWGKATALHEIGHSLGLEHEHQNPKSGLIWDEEAVYDYFKRNDGWESDVTYSNIIEKLEANAVEGSAWDPLSIMHYPFEPGLIKAPEPYRETGIGENTELSQADMDWALHWYPQQPDAVPLGTMEVARFPGVPGSQIDLSFTPQATRDYQIRGVGTADLKIVLFEMRDGDPRHYDAEDDSGAPDNAVITAKLVAGRDYVVRSRLHYQPPGAEAGIVIV